MTYGFEVDEVPSGGKGVPVYLTDEFDELRSTEAANDLRSEGVHVAGLVTYGDPRT